MPRTNRLRLNLWYYAAGLIGTSLQVYPDAGLLDFTSATTIIYNVDPNSVMQTDDNLTIIKQNAGVAVPLLVTELLSDLV